MEKITLDHFVLLTVIGKGSYAKVVLVKKKVNWILIQSSG
jgi:serum/glucocorticoid-regulated kinase 2